MHGFNGYPLVLLVFSVVGEGYCLLLRKGVRLISLFAATTAVLAVAAIPPWRDALAGVFGTGPGLVILVLIAFFGGIAYVTDHMRHLHVARTPVIGTLAATAAVLAYAMRAELGAQGAKLIPKTGAALNQATHQISSGQAAAAMTGSSRAVVLAVGAAVVFTVWRIRRKLHQTRPFTHAQPFGVVSGAKAITAGPGGGSGKTKRGLLSRIFGGN